MNAQLAIFQTICYKLVYFDESYQVKPSNSRELEYGGLGRNRTERPNRYERLALNQ